MSIAIVKPIFFILCLFCLSGRLAADTPKEELNQDLRLRLIAEPGDLPGLVQFARKCHEELRYYFPATANTTDAAILTICYDVQPPKGVEHPVMLSAAYSREEQAYQIFKAFLQRDFIGAQQVVPAGRLNDLDWLIAGLTFSCLHGSSMGSERIVPDAKPVLGFYFGLKSFSLADWISEPIRASPSLAYRIYGLNSLHLMGLFNLQPNTSVQNWLALWSGGASVQEATCQSLTPKGKPQDLDAWITKEMIKMLRSSMVLPAEDLQRQIAFLDTWPILQGTAIQALDLATAAEKIGRETVGKQRSEDYLWLDNHTFLFLKPAMRDFVDGALHLQKGNGWRSQRSFASGRKELEKHLAYSRQVQQYLDVLETRQTPLREIAPTLFLIEDKAMMDDLRQTPALYYWLESLEAKTPAP